LGYQELMASTMRRRIKFLLLLAGLYDAAWRVIGLCRRMDPRLWGRNRRVRRRGAPDGFPLPPPRLAYAVAASQDLDYFFEAGRSGGRGSNPLAAIFS